MVCFPGWIRMSVRFNIGSLLLEYLLSAGLSCMEKKRKLSTLWRMSRMVLLFLQKTTQLMDLWKWWRLWKVLCKRYHHIWIDVQLLYLVYLNVHSLPLFEGLGLVPHLKLFLVLKVGFFWSPFRKCHLLMRLYKWGYQWLFIQNPLEKIASSFCFAIWSSSIMVGFSCFCQEWVVVVR